MPDPIQPEDLVLHFLNVGFGDNIIVQFPADENGVRQLGLVDCFLADKTLDYLDKLIPSGTARPHLAFICATHPHEDHIKGILKVMKSEYCPEEFWDSGFRHQSLAFISILETVIKQDIKMVRVSSGMEWYFHKVRVTALSPSIMLRNNYATYGVDMNNASIILRLENNVEDVLLAQSKEYTGTQSLEAERDAGRSVAILAGDAEFDSWSHVCQEFPTITRDSKNNPLVKKMINYLNAYVIKVAHHGSKHSTPLDVYEKMTPSLAVISTRQKTETTQLSHTNFPSITRVMFPHPAATTALEEADIRVLTTDGSYESQKVDDNSIKDAANKDPGTIVVVIPPGGRVRWKKLADTAASNATPPDNV